MWDPFASFSKQTLDNGLVVYTSEWKDRPLQVFHFVVNTGGFHDEPHRHGTAHFIEHMVSKNALLPYQELRDFFDNVGGFVRLGSTSMLSTRYSCGLPLDQKHIARGLELFGHMLLSASLTQNFEREGTVIQSEFEREFPLKISQSMQVDRYKALLEGLPGTHPYWVIGDPETRRTMTAAQLQEEYDRRYLPASMSVITAGGLSHPESMSAIHASPFAHAKQGAASLPVVPLQSFRAPHEALNTVHLADHIKDIQNASNSYETACVVPKALFSDITLALYLDILDEHTFRVFREEKGWAYHVGSGYQDLGVAHDLKITMDGIPKDAIAQVDDLMTHCIEKASTDAVAFEKFKLQRLNSLGRHDLSVRAVTSQAASDVASYGRIIPMQEEDDRINQVTLADMALVGNALSRTKRWSRFVLASV